MTPSEMDAALAASYVRWAEALLASGDVKGALAMYRNAASYAIRATR